ncbi:MAG: GGDEF domain-containing protein [Lachnospiraceae bacterium]|nr:GGDEF domain-containing protein [Lachnospiraceae bacterium]
MFKRLKGRGISVEKFNRVMCILAVLISIVMFVAMGFTYGLYQETRTITKEMLELTRSANEMQDASDYLTEQIRCFAVSGEVRYLEHYFTEALVTQRREKALEALGGREEYKDAYDSLYKAMQDSLELMDTEYYAARLAADAYGISSSQLPNQVSSVELTQYDQSLSHAEKADKAESILFDENYRAKKESIYSNMEKCLYDLNGDLDQKQDDVFHRFRMQMGWEHILTILLIGIMVGIVVVCSQQVLYPLKKTLEYVRNDEEIPVTGAYELRYLEKTYNLMNRAGKEKREKLLHEASHDKLTGIYNRRGYEFLLKNLDMEDAAFLMLDLDRFKGVNDNYGHDVGDKVLTRLTATLMKYFKDDAYICRLGGDEFVIIMIHAGESRSANIRERVQKINARLEKPKGNTPAITISVGVAFGAQNKDPDTLYKEADEALYHVKEHGRNGICFYSELKKQSYL